MLLKSVLESSGFNEIWLYPESVHINSFIPSFIIRMKDLHITNWATSINMCSSLKTFRYMKTNYEISTYIDILDNKQQRSLISKIRLSSHDLKIETGRYNNTNRNERYCELCQLHDIEDEYHFTLICPHYKEIRSKYVTKYFSKNPSMYKYFELLNSSKNKMCL